MDQRFANTTRTMLFIIFFTSVVGLITMPLFPWISSETEWGGETHTSYISEGDIHIASEQTGSSKEIRNLDGDLGMIGISFWLSLIFGIIALVGLAVYRAGGRIASIGHILLLIGAVVIVFAILAVVYHGLFIMDLGELEETMGTSYSMLFFYNYIPAIMAVILLIASIIYLAVVVPFSARALFAYRPRYPPQPYPPPPQYPQQPVPPEYQQYPPEQQPPSQPPQPPKY